jgi:hypothetical protein
MLHSSSSYQIIWTPSRARYQFLPCGIISQFVASASATKVWERKHRNTAIRTQLNVLLFTQPATTIFSICFDIVRCTQLLLCLYRSNSYHVFDKRPQWCSSPEAFSATGLHCSRHQNAGWHVLRVSYDSMSSEPHTLTLFSSLSSLTAPQLGAHAIKCKPTLDAPETC